MEEKTLQQIFEETRAAALAGDAQAQYQLAYLYDRGEGTAVAPNKASVWYALAAEQGYPPARSEFAMLLLRKVQPSAKEEGVRLLRLSADAGDAQAMFRLGECFRKGWGTERDLSASIGWYTLAAQAGNAQGAYALALLCLNGEEGFAQDKETGLNWLRQAAEQGYGEALCLTGKLYETGDGVPQDEKKAYEYYCAAQSAQCGEGAFRAARFQEEGVGTEKNAEEAVKGYRSAGASGYTHAYYYLGRCYALGIGVAADAKQAIFQWRHGANLGDAPCMYVAGYCYETGFGVTVDTELALYCYMEAHFRGDARALKAFDRLKETLSAR